MAEILRFPGREAEPLEPVSELIAASPTLYEKLLAGQALDKTVELGYD